VTSSMAPVMARTIDDRSGMRIRIRDSSRPWWPGHHRRRSDGTV